MDPGTWQPFFTAFETIIRLSGSLMCLTRRERHRSDRRKGPTCKFAATDSNTHTGDLWERVSCEDKYEAWGEGMQSRSATQRVCCHVWTEIRLYQLWPWLESTRTESFHKNVSICFFLEWHKVEYSILEGNSKFRVLQIYVKRQQKCHCFIVPFGQTELNPLPIESCLERGTHLLGSRLA